MTAKKVLISGGTGLIGSRLTELLLEKGYDVSYLSRNKNKEERIRTFEWNIKNMTIEKEAFEGVDFIVHLAGASVADERWTKERKKTILESRIKSTELLLNGLKETGSSPKVFISSSGVGYYGADTGDEWKKESDSPGDDFLARVCIDWENIADSFKSLQMRVVKIRTGFVLSQKGGALPKIAQPVKLGAGAPLGNGKQWISWIHVDDLVRMIIFSMENDEVSDAINGVAPNPITNKELTQMIAGALNRPLILPNVPSFALKLMLGEMAEIVLGGQRASCEKIQSHGFQFKFTDAKEAVQNILVR
jgi:uncharacterized protein